MFLTAFATKIRGHARFINCLHQLLPVDIEHEAQTQLLCSLAAEDHTAEEDFEIIRHGTGVSVDLQAQANAEVKAYFASFAERYTVDENGTVQVIAPDFGAIADKIGQKDAASLTTAEQWQALVEEHAEKTKMYIMTVDEVSDEAVEAAFLDQVLTELFKRWVAQMDLTLLAPSERRDG